MAFVFAAVCVVSAVYAFVTNFKGTRKFDTLDAIATTATFVLFLIFATLAYKCLCEFQKSDELKCENNSCEKIHQ
jgi:SNF family Na+-dependent transporter